MAWPREGAHLEFNDVRDWIASHFDALFADEDVSPCCAKRDSRGLATQDAIRVREPHKIELAGGNDNNIAITACRQPSLLKKVEGVQGPYRAIEGCVTTADVVHLAINKPASWQAVQDRRGTRVSAERCRACCMDSGFEVKI
mmetsp:Transcript_45412/g.119265  ORF Transcript_45412/g.119265 Transcript_45412/m.119265 type:complete len:142 (-) Transcript_45412:137-562(-)